MEQVNKHEISILCVDDNQEIRELLQVIVARLGHNSVTAMDGNTHLEEFANPSVIIHAEY